MDTAQTTDTDSITAKVQALLAKAESTSFGPEAEAFIAKAQDLITRYSLSPEALARASKTGDKPVHIEVPITGTYADARGALLGRIAAANRCKVVHSKRTGSLVCHVFGYRSDAEAVELLYASLQVVAASELLVESKKAKAADALSPSYYRSFSPRAFARNFWLGFAIRIGERLAEINTRAEGDAVTATASTALVLRDRRLAVQESLREVFPYTTSSTSRVTSRGGFSAGQAAANRANLSRSVGGTGARALAR